eukprot:3982839-Pyramimonas_sp.AAC.1
MGLQLADSTEIKRQGQHARSNAMIMKALGGDDNKSDGGNVDGIAASAEQDSSYDNHPSPS